VFKRDVEVGRGDSEVSAAKVVDISCVKYNNDFQLPMMMG